MSAGDGARDIPESWYQAVHPRRGGRIPARISVLEDPSQARIDSRIVIGPAFEAVLDHPDSDPSAVFIARYGNKVEQAAVRLAVARTAGHASPLFPAELWAQVLVRGLGLPAAVEIFVRSQQYVAVNMLFRRGFREGAPLLADVMVPPGDSLRRRLTYPDLDLDPSNGFRCSNLYPGLRYLRAATVLAEDSEYQQIVEVLEQFRDRPVHQRVLTSYLLPERRDWVAADIGDFPIGFGNPAELLFYSLWAPAQFDGWWGDELQDFVTAWDSCGDDAAPVLWRSFDRAWENRPARQSVLEILGRIPTDATFNWLLDRTEMPDIPAAIRHSADQFPERAAQLMAGRSAETLIECLLAQHLVSHPDLPEAKKRASSRSVDAIAAKLPELLRIPPWTRSRLKSVKIERPEVPVTLTWQDGEREEWSWEPWPGMWERENWSGSQDEKEQTARFILHAPAEMVLPQLASWAAEDHSFYLQEPKLLVTKYGLDALPAILRLARRKPVVGAPLLLPYLSSDVAELMAKWLASSRQFRPLAMQWFQRHGTEAVKPLLPAALHGVTSEERSAASALRRLDPEVVRAAGRQLSCADHVEQLLATDPLQRIPAKVPQVPAWLCIEALPQVLLAGTRKALPQREVRTLCRLIAMSELDAPYEGLSIMAQACDQRTLAEFSWALFCHWTLAGRPSKDVWAMNALGYFGDDEVADRLAPMVRRWPSEGAAARAKRGVDLLAIMNSDRALQQLSALRRNAKSSPLRAHAGVALDRTALERGLLPEQLDDLLVPDLGLGDIVEYQGASYTVTLGPRCELILRGPDGSERKSLPKAVAEEDKSVVTGWNRQRKLATSTIADQVHRLEEAMIVQRRWGPAEFKNSVIGHPLLSRLARRLIWQTGDGTAVLDELDDLVDPAGGLVSPGDWVQVAHPATSNLQIWTGWAAKDSVSQPFTQIDRDTYQEDPSTFWQQTVEAVSLHSLIRRGWHWGPTGRAAKRHRIIRDFGAAGRVVLAFTPGITAVFDPVKEPVQTIDELGLESPRHGEFAVFGDLPKVTRSELIRDLRSLR